MAEYLEPMDATARSRVRPPVLGRMSVFVIGLFVGIALGAAAGVAGWEYARPWTEPAPVLQPARTAAAKPKTEKVVAPAQALAVTPGKPLVIGVFGDSMADGLWAGLYRQLDRKSYDVVRFSQASTGLTNYQYVDVQQKTLGQLQDKHIDVAVVLFGANDAQGMLYDGKVLNFDTPAWKAAYAKRMDDLVTLLKAHGAAVYWVGLPRMRRTDYERRVSVLNGIYQERAGADGVAFIPTVPVTVDKDGGYDDYLVPDEGGRAKLMRAKDGIHMTMAGYLRIAGPVSGLIRTDVDKSLAVQHDPVTLVASPVSMPVSGR